MIRVIDDLFDNEYAYFSSFSSGWLQHVKRFTQDIIKRLNLNEKSHVVEEEVLWCENVCRVAAKIFV